MAAVYHHNGETTIDRGGKRTVIRTTSWNERTAEYLRNTCGSFDEIHGAPPEKAAATAPKYIGGGSLSESYGEGNNRPE